MLTLFEQEPTMTTPQIKLDPQNGEIELGGNILTVDCPSLFDPILNWMDLYIKNPNHLTNVIIQLEYFNTQASKYLLEIFKKIEKIYFSENDVIVKWFCDKDDFDMMEAAEDYKAIIKFPIHIIER